MTEPEIVRTTDAEQLAQSAAARLAKLPADAVGLQYCDPRSTVQNLCCVGPLVLSAVTRFGGNNNQSDFDPIDIGLIPNGLELSKHLFPNLTVTRDDGRTVRIDVNESFSLPGEFIGFEPAAFAIITFALILGAATFNLFYSFAAGMLMFAGLYVFALWATRRDPDMLRIPLSSPRFKTRYDAAKHDPYVIEVRRC